MITQQQVRDMRSSIGIFVGSVLAVGAPAAWSAPPEATAYQITVDHAGVTTSGGVLALQETPLWSATLNGASSYPIIADGRVFVTTASMPGGTGNDSKSQLYGFDAHTGASLWAPISVSGTYFWSAAAYDGGTLFVVNSDGLLRSYDAATGTPGWTVQMPGQYGFSSPPTAYNGIVYVGGAGDGGTVYAVAESDGTVLWTATVANGDNSSPAVSPTGVYVSYPCQVYDFNLTTGTPVWHYNGGCDGGGGKTPVYAGGKLFVRDPGISFDIFNSADGAITGSFHADPAPAIGQSSGFFVFNSILSAIDLASNSTQWTFAGDNALTSAPIVVDQTVIVGSGSGYLYGFDTQSGNLTWQVNAGSATLGPDQQNDGVPLPGMAVADGVLAVPAGTNLLTYAIFGPPAPTGLTASPAVTSVRLNWTGAAGMTYNIYQGAAAGAESLVPVQTGVAGTSTSITGLTFGTTYYFVVKATGSAGISARSNEVSAAPAAPLSGPTKVTATPGIGQIGLSWAASSQATGYKIYMAEAPGQEGITPVKTVTGTTATVTGLKTGGTYYFVIAADTPIGLSSPSAEVHATTSIPASPAAVVSAGGGGGGGSLGWIDFAVLLALTVHRALRHRGRGI